MVFTILAMGCLTVILVIVTGNVYRQLILENQSRALADIVDQEVAEQIKNAGEKAIRLAQFVQANKDFRQAIDESQSDQLQKELDDQLYHHYVVTGEVDIEQLTVFDDKFELVARAVAETSRLDGNDLQCYGLLEKHKGKTAQARFQPVSEQCLIDGKLYLSAVVPVSGVKLKGYLQTIVDPLLEIKNIERHFGMPLMVRYVNHREAYRSELWPTHIEPDTTIVVEDALKDPDGKEYLFVRLAFDVSELQQKLGQTRWYILLGAALATLVTIFLAIHGLQKAALLPLERLTYQLAVLREDNGYLGQKVEVSGNREISQLAKGFNAFTSELHKAYQKLDTLAFTDSLTSLPNRELFYDRLNQLILLCQRERMVFSLFVMDLNRFKYINDTLGHNVGDQLLTQAGVRIRAAVREVDTVARLGGDEFAALLPKVVDIQGARIVAERINAALSEPFIIDGNSLHAGVSIGIVMFPYHGEAQNELIQRADVAMYYAKNNQLGHAFYESEIDSHNVLELTLETELKHAVQNGLLKLFYQPKILIETGEVYGVEALLRWNHSEHGFIPPDSFIPMAEQTGLIHPLTRWVLKTAIEQVRQWHSKGIMLNVAINLSAQSLRAPGMVESIMTVLNEAGVEPKYLTLELTETAVMSDPKRALEILSLLDDMGVRLSIDDFGTGYSSLSYLKRLPVDEIKIDRSFVMEMDKDNNDEVIVHSTIELAHNMGLKVIAEGIETEQSWLTLKTLGCDVGQGYFMCRPIDAQSFNEWFDNSVWKIPRVS